MPHASSTIAAIATAPGRGGVGIIRISGPLSLRIAQDLFNNVQLPPRQAKLVKIHDAAGNMLDEGIGLYFPAPHSFTGEDVVEFQGHGSPILLDLILARIVGLGAHLAKPGEFSERAFLNDKMDLLQAEAIADLIDGASTAAVRAAARSMQGEFSQHIRAMSQQIVELRTHVEATIDFSDEEIDFLHDAALHQRLTTIQSRLNTVFAAAQQGSILREGITVVIAGLPNAGKSSLLNRLTGTDTAIVTEIAGTTRDVLRTQIQIDGMPIHVIDTAGLRDTRDVVEQIGIDRARGEIQRADCVLLVIDDRRPFAEQIAEIQPPLPANLPMIVVRNKIDLSARQPAVQQGPRGVEIAVSALTGAGMELLRAQLKQTAGFQDSAETTFMARRRHLAALQQADSYLKQAADALTHGKAELVAEELRHAHRALGELVGEFTSEDLLGAIFSTFCIGK